MQLEFFKTCKCCRSEVPVTLFRELPLNKCFRCMPFILFCIFSLIHRHNSLLEIRRKKKAMRKRVYGRTTRSKLFHNIRKRTKMYLRTKNWQKNSSISKMVGCSPLELKVHLENQFTEGMTWENYGKWQIDHIYPISKAANPEALSKITHFSNLQPLWKNDNLRKGNRVPETAKTRPNPAKPVFTLDSVY